MSASVQIPQKELSSSLSFAEKHLLPYIDAAHLELSRERAEHARTRAIENLERNLLEYESKAISKNIQVAYRSEFFDFENEIQRISSLIRNPECLFLSHAYDPFGHNKYIDASKKYLSEAKTKAGAPVQHVVVAIADQFVAETAGIFISSNDPRLKNAMSGSRFIIIAPIKNIAKTLTDAEHVLMMKNIYSGNDFLEKFTLKINRADDHEVHVLLVEEQVVPLLEDKETRAALYCIECGACEKACPVSHITSSSAQQYSTMRTLAFPGIEKYNEYSNIPSGNIARICPVKIDTDKINSIKRQKLENTMMRGASEKLFKAAFRKALLNRKFMNQGNKMKSFIIQSLVPRQVYKAMPEFAPETFNELWRKQHQ